MLTKNDPASKFRGRVEEMGPTVKMEVDIKSLAEAL